MADGSTKIGIAAVGLAAGFLAGRATVGNDTPLYFHLTDKDGKNVARVLAFQKSKVAVVLGSASTITALDETIKPKYVGTQLPSDYMIVGVVTVPQPVAGERVLIGGTWAV